MANTSKEQDGTTTNRRATTDTAPHTHTQNEAKRRGGKEKLEKKKKKKPEEGAEDGEEGAPGFGYAYEFMLQRVYGCLKINNPSTLKKKTIKPPNVVRDGTKKCAFTNFYEICKSLNRTPEHLLAFTQTELGTTGAIDANNCLILRGRFQSKHLEALLRRYVTEYVQCAMCHSLDTKLVKDPNTRLYGLNCTSCSASRTVQAIQSGFTATMKGDRRKARQVSGK
eukprot:TRINITY_DN3782_c0_g1_i1.p1 TRINITY_DN3782_c0_g1~~TRINITY_DN3782_c0_g1_i1.p1  ORF type:complete len:224 (+),score=42.03 TRINITY_DN3782_c0_g1_i1:179-850(+)